MDKIFKNKWILTCIIFLILGITFVYILNLRPDLNLKGGYWIFSFLLTLLFYYFIFILSTILQIFLIKCFRIMPIKVFSLYPITYDGSFRFYPIRLIYNIEAFNNSLILNLALYFKDDRQLMNQMKKLLILRKISILLSISLLFLLLNRFDVKTTIVFLIAALSMILVSYFQYGAYWYGYDYLYSKGAASLKEYLLASKSIMILDSIQYADALKQEHEDEYLECSILENYLYRSILDNKSICSMDIIRAATLRQIDKIEFFRINLTLDAKRINLIKLIGWTGIKCDDPELVDLSVEQHTRIYELIANNSLPFFQKFAPATIRKQIKAIKSGQQNIGNVLKLLDMQNVFSTYDTLF